MARNKSTVSVSSHTSFLIACVALWHQGKMGKRQASPEQAVNQFSVLLAPWWCKIDIQVSEAGVFLGRDSEQTSLANCWTEQFWVHLWWRLSVHGGVFFLTEEKKKNHGFAGSAENISSFCNIERFETVCKKTEEVCVCGGDGEGRGAPSSWLLSQKQSKFP